MDWRTDPELTEAFRLVSDRTAAALGLGAYGLVTGAPADLVLIHAETIPEAVVARPRRELVVAKGRVQPPTRERARQQAPFYVT
jgi:cytosine/adenosine deaminase-related metal-dependent hydrolase